MTFNVQSGLPSTQYGTVTNNAYQNFMGNSGSGPLNYNVPAQSIRGSAGEGGFTTGNNNSRQDRVQNMVNRALEKFDAQIAIRQGMMDRWNQDWNQSVAPTQQQLQQGPYGQGLTRTTYGGNASQDSYSQFMNSQSGDALFGGTRTTPEQRYSALNNEISRRGNLANQVTAPIYGRFGYQQPISRPMRVGFGGLLG